MTFFMISYIEVDGTRTQYANNKPVFPRTYRLRAPKRTLPEDESIIELRLRHKIAFRRFVPEISQSYVYLMRTFHIGNIPVYLMRTFHIGNIPFILIRGIALFFSHVLNIPYPREYYRCKYTSIYWLNEHLAVIRAYNATHLVKINYKNQEYRLD